MRQALPVVLGICLPGLLTATAGGAMIQGGTDATVAASDTDLLQTSLDEAVLSGDWEGEGASGAPGALSDGLAIYSSSPDTPRYKVDKTLYGAPDSGATVTFVLDTQASPPGYNITGLDFYHGWGDDGRDGFRFVIEYATVDAPETFVQYGTTAYYDPESDYGRTEVTDDTGLIATDVAKLRITPTEIDHGMGGLSEIDAFGAPVPEPTCLAVLALGGLAVLRRRRQG